MTKSVDWLLVSVGEDRELAMDALHFQAQELSIYNKLLKDGVCSLQTHRISTKIPFNYLKLEN